MTRTSTGIGLGLGRPLGLAPLLLALPLAVTSPAPALACGCFTPPDPVNNVIQSGENILFSAANGQVTALIQIQYQGAAADFGWLLPLPSVPTLEVSSDTVFAALTTGTQPSYQTIVRGEGCVVSSPDLPLAFGNPDFGAANGGGGPPDPLVLQDSVGPYDYAVLKADDKSAMLDWLSKNRYFVPAGTDSAVVPYIHPGAYFLALKLHSGKSSGDIAPVVVRYASDLPMIPITLTSVGASESMGVWVWVLGSARAIPRNYRHVTLDDARLFQPWSNGLPGNYEFVVNEAVKAAPGHHAFVTELARPVADVKSTLFPEARFGNLDDLRKTTDAANYLRYLRNNGYPFSSELIGILQKYIKQPSGLVRLPGSQEPSAANYFYNFDFYRQNFPMAFKDFDLTFDAVKLTDDIEARIVKPVRAAAALFDGQKYLTRLHTRLSPADMNSDPVFSFNPDLPPVSNVHRATLWTDCHNGVTRNRMVTEQDFVYEVNRDLSSLPAALTIGTLSESGPEVIETDNHTAIRAALGGGVSDMGLPPEGVDAGVPDPQANASGPSCAVGGNAPPRWPLGLVVLALAISIRGARARRRR